MEFTGKMPDASPGASVLCEPPQSKYTRTFHKSHVVEIGRKNAQRDGYHLD